MTLKTVYVWFKKFSAGRESGKDEHWSVRPTTANTAYRYKWIEVVFASTCVTELSHPLYSPDLSPLDFFQFHKPKITLKGQRFTDIMHIQAAATQELKDVPLEEFSRAFDDLYTHCQRCIVYNWDYGPSALS
ncbi:hypothetical protein AVEN_112537-1 [Araneus ventricosus]|uniref:Mos1 transposase HTH domain-containing protein n=1 Tax=Araneus ventricosus TaxID=182803 RepID=A0A4Y2RS06_ARAVE|nr:hypothetical protein AVEN_161887-1 [Araneus ventricosus]GBN78733.1 hypothetical protein AVEN_112537-1 [Araneus ventricosus]